MSDTDEATPEQKAERAMDFVDAQADQWAAEVNLTAMIKNVANVARLKPSTPVAVREKFIARMEAQIDAIARQCFLEGWLRHAEIRRAVEAAKARDNRP